MKRQKVVTKAETSLDRDLLEKLRDEARKMRKWVKVKKAGVTDAVVFEIRLAWRRNELAMVKLDVPLCPNMDRAREILELKTGGLVIWTKKDAHAIYRGENYQSKSSVKIYPCNADGQETPFSTPTHLDLENKVSISQIKSNTTAINENICGLLSCLTSR